MTTSPNTTAQISTLPPKFQTFTPRQKKLIAALVADPDIAAGCKVAGIGRTTAHTWLRDQAFKEALARERDAVFAAAMNAIKAHVTRAVSELASLLDTKDADLRRLVCKDILSHALKVRELEDIEARIDALEKALHERDRR